MNNEELKTIVVELSGKASVVALLDFINTAKKENKTYNLIFSVAYVPSEYEDDPENNIFALGEILKMHAQRYGHNVTEMLYSAETGVWFKTIKPSLTATYEGTGSLNSLAYCHLCRLDVAATSDASILTGERLSHSTKVKLDQSKEIFDFFDKYFANYDISFIRPLLNVSDDKLIDLRYKMFCDEYGFSVNKYTFPKCYLFDDTKYNNSVVSENILKYLDVLGEHMDNILDEYRYESNKLQ